MSLMDIAMPPWSQVATEMSQVATDIYRPNGGPVPLLPEVGRRRHGGARVGVKALGEVGPAASP